MFLKLILTSFIQTYRDSILEFTRKQFLSREKKSVQLKDDFSPITTTSLLTRVLFSWEESGKEKEETIRDVPKKIVMNNNKK